MGINVPAVCDDCGAVFPSGIALGPSVTNIRMTGNKSGPCPNCRGWGSVPDGVYDTVGDALNIVSTWSQERIDRLSESLERARTASDPLAATQTALAQEQELSTLASRLLIPSNPAEFWAFVAALFAILMFFKT
jgi:crotonobetainyl-CoA:carnitine CoA-transferase CaiB-like acyl-CoA transferase